MRAEAIERFRKLRVIVEAQSEMCLSLIDAALDELEAVNEDGNPPCPECGELEKLEDTTPMGPEEGMRMTCLSCGKSYWVQALTEEQEVMSG